MVHDWERTAAEMARMSRALLELAQPGAVENAIVDWAVRSVPGCEAAGLVTATRGARVSCLAASGPLPRGCDDLQHELREGPCHDALWEGTTFIAVDLIADTRWPAWSPAAVRLGVRSVMGFPLSTEGGVLGALNFYATRPHAFDQLAQRIAAICAAHAAVGFRWAQTAHNLRQAIASREEIGQAVGILVERMRITPEQAFQELNRVSSHTNLKVRDLARTIVLTGQLPTVPGEAGEPAPA